ncbi:MAG: hypothetical protein Q8P81_02675, partial [Nanoarchaeota archaeon]|nr:hypothetical protein [Nanoarchaeota archaeon]
MSEEIKINAVFILDIIGKPAEYLVESIEKAVEGIGKEKGVEVVSRDIKEPELMKDQKDFYTTFAEVEVNVDDISTLVLLVFKYMPAHIEIISPNMLAMTNNIFNDVLNELVRRLHGYDELSRVMQVEKQILVKKIEELGGEVPKEIM